jgi:hypothetical protein
MSRALWIGVLAFLSTVVFAADPGGPQRQRLLELERLARPNPKVQDPTPTPTPPKELPPKSELENPGATGSERFVRSLADLLTSEWRDNIVVWLPAIRTDPNSGTEWGVMPVLLLVESPSRRIRHLIAPSYTYNRIFGHSAYGNYFYYPNDDAQLYLGASVSQRTNRELEAHYENKAIAGKWLYFDAHVDYAIYGTPRFYGLGPKTKKNSESGYTATSYLGTLSMGLNFLDAWRVSAGVRYRRLDVGGTIIPGVQDLRQSFPDVNGVNGSESVSHELRLLWDTRDFPTTPSRGASGEVFIERTSQLLGSDSSFIRYGAKMKRFFPWPHTRQVSVLRGLFQKANGPKIPFFDLPTIGGRETLRGFGDGRFVDRGAMVFNAEHRITFAAFKLMNVETAFEVAPFVDVGTVFPDARGIQRKYFRTVEGVAFRTAFKPNVVGDLEVGMGNEGPAVFVELEYPF